MEENVQNPKYQKIILITLLLFVISLALYFSNYHPPPRPYAIKVKQKAQLKVIQAAIELFNSENDGYPPSDELDQTGRPYCGAMKLCEAMIGRDLLGFHPDSVFRADGMDVTNTRQLYPIPPSKDNLGNRLGPLLQFDWGNPYRLLNIYGLGNTDSFNEDHFVLCDVYTRKMRTGKKMGMPILYYKANTSHTEHDVNNPDNPKNRYNYKDNHALLSLGVPGKSNEKHPLFTNPRIFYEMTKNRDVTSKSKSVRVDSYILISAGKDGLYGTTDDICNFDWRYRDIENLIKTEDQS